MPVESYRRPLWSSLLCLCDVIRALINSLVCLFCTSAPGPRSVSNTKTVSAPRTRFRGRKVSKYVSWCFTPSQPVRLYQGDTHLILYI